MACVSCVACVSDPASEVDEASDESVESVSERERVELEDETSEDESEHEDDEDDPGGVQSAVAIGGAAWCTLGGGGDRERVGERRVGVCKRAGPIVPRKGGRERGWGRTRSGRRCCREEEGGRRKTERGRKKEGGGAAAGRRPGETRSAAQLARAERGRREYVNGNVGLKERGGRLRSGAGRSKKGAGNARRVAAGGAWA